MTKGKKMQNKIFGTLADGDDVYLIELFSKDLCVKILTLGAILQEMKFKDKPVVLGYSELEPYIDNKFYYGAIIGRFANRLKNGQAKLSQGNIKLKLIRIQAIIFMVDPKEVVIKIGEY